MEVFFEEKKINLTLIYEYNELSSLSKNKNKNTTCFFFQMSVQDSVSIIHCFTRKKENDQNKLNFEKNSKPIVSYQMANSNNKTHQTITQQMLNS